MQVKFKKLDPEAVLPKYSKPGDAGLDLTATHSEYIGDGITEYSTGLAVEIPEGHVGLIFPRSSIYLTTQTLSNSVGVVDSGYRGEIKFKFRCEFWGIDNYKVGDRVGQLIIMPYPKIEVVDCTGELSDTVRGTSGFGSSGR